MCSGGRIRPPTTEVAAVSIHRHPSSVGAKECSPRREPWADMRRREPAPKGRKKRTPLQTHPCTALSLATLHSIPNVLLVVLHVILLQKHDELFLERSCAMMLLLSGNIFRHVGHTRFADAENSVTCLPRKLGGM